MSAADRQWSLILPRSSSKAIKQYIKTVQFLYKPLEMKLCNINEILHLTEIALRLLCACKQFWAPQLLEMTNMVFSGAEKETHTPSVSVISQTD